MVKPEPMFQCDLVERFTLQIPGAQNAFIDTHEIDGITIYIKIFFLFNILQIINKSSYSKRIDNLMLKNNDFPNMQLSISFRKLTGQKNCYVYNHGNAVIISNSGISMAQQEFQIHIYDSDMFELLFGLFV